MSYVFRCSPGSELQIGDALVSFKVRRHSCHDGRSGTDGQGFEYVLVVDAPQTTKITPNPRGFSRQDAAPPVIQGRVPCSNVIPKI